MTLSHLISMQNIKKFLFSNLGTLSISLGRRPSHHVVERPDTHYEMVQGPCAHVGQHETLYCLEIDRLLCI
jgi:hypothetical protein